jgi:RimJ/RimL family protein N-acetyltransferase
MGSVAPIETSRLLLRRPVAADARRIFDRYAGDEVVCRYLAWPRHESIEDSLDFVRFSDHEWARWPAGPFVVLSRENGDLLGSTGLAFESTARASTGYVFARDAWGAGYATEAVLAMRSLASDLGVRRLTACCHPDHTPSRRVLEKAGFALEGTLPRYCEFPNLSPAETLDVVCYSLTPEA